MIVADGERRATIQNFLSFIDVDTYIVNHFVSIIAFAHEAIAARQTGCMVSACLLTAKINYSGDATVNCAAFAIHYNLTFITLALVNVKAVVSIAVKSRFTAAYCVASCEVTVSIGMAIAGVW